MGAMEEDMEVMEVIKWQLHMNLKLMNLIPKGYGGYQGHGGYGGYGGHGGHGGHGGYGGYGGN